MTNEGDMWALTTFPIGLETLQERRTPVLVWIVAKGVDRLLLYIIPDVLTNIVKVELAQKLFDNRGV